MYCKEFPQHFKPIFMSHLMESFFSSFWLMLKHYFSLQILIINICEIVQQEMLFIAKSTIFLVLHIYYVYDWTKPLFNLPC